MKVGSYSEFDRSQNETGEKIIWHPNLQSSQCKFHFCIEKAANANCEVQRIGNIDRIVEELIIAVFQLLCM